MCEFCKNADWEIQQYKNGYGDKYLPETMDALDELREKLCEAKSRCQEKDCQAGRLIGIIDTDPDIRRKKGL